MPDLSYFSVFLLGLLGGFHCAGMCGGIVVLLNRPVIPIAISASDEGSDLVSMQARVCEPLASVLARQIAYSLGRVGSYSLAGGLMGALGSSALLLKQSCRLNKLVLCWSMRSCSPLPFIYGVGVRACAGLNPPVAGFGPSYRPRQRVTCPRARSRQAWQPGFFGAGCPAAWCMACCSRRLPVNMRLKVHCFLQVLALVPCLILSRWAWALSASVDS